MVKRNKESSKNFAKVKKGHSKIHSKSKAKSMNSNNPDREVPAGGNFLYNIKPIKESRISIDLKQK